MHKNLWNLNQKARELFGIKPLNCWCSDRSKYPCNAGDLFLCEMCDRLYPWCRGSDDSYAEICDNCYAIANEMHDSAGISLELEI